MTRAEFVGNVLDGLPVAPARLKRRALLGAALAGGPGAVVGRPLGLAAGPDAGPRIARLALEARIAREQAALGESIAGAHELGADVHLAAAAGGERAPGAVAARKLAGHGPAVDDAPQRRLGSRAAAPVAAAPLLRLRHLDAGEPHRGRADAQPVTADRPRPAFERPGGADRGQPG